MNSPISNVAFQPILEGTDRVGKQCPICGDMDAQLWLTAPDRFHGRDQRYTLLRCRSCELVWLDNPPETSAMGQHYGQDYDRTITMASADPNHWSERRETLLLHKSSGAILDLGCSSGAFLASMKGPNWKLFGVEMSENVARSAESRCGAEVFVGDILDAPYPAGSFDAITCFQVFEHLYQPRAVLSKVVEWLKPGGIFYAMMPNIDSAGARIFRSYWYPLELPRHLYHFSPRTLSSMAKSVGLEELSVSAHRELFFEASAYYVVDDILKKAGCPRAPMANASAPGIPFRVIRKLFRLSVLPLVDRLAAFSGDGETITAIFQKGKSERR